MKEFLVTIDCDYIAEHLRHGHLQSIVEANSPEEAKAIISDKGFSDFDLMIDDYSVDDYSVGGNPIEVQEMEYE